MGWAAFWATFLQTHLVTLTGTEMQMQCTHVMIYAKKTNQHRGDQYSVGLG
jgi:hypothetical protein